MRRAATKITSAIGDVRDAMKCDHDFTFVRWTDSGAQVKTCSKCKCRFTSWMGSEHWDATIQKPTSQERPPRIASSASRHGAARGVGAGYVMANGTQPDDDLTIANL